MDALSIVPDSVVNQSEIGIGGTIKWRMATNHLNFLYMMGLGLVVPPAGFGHKYYKDLLALQPGWIPLFAEKIPEIAFKESIAESKALIQCCLEFDLSKVSGLVRAQRGDIWLDIKFPEEVLATDTLILLPAPLPINLIKEAIFQSKENKEVCEKRAAESSNVCLSAIKCSIKASIFKIPSKLTPCIWPPTGIESIGHREVDLNAPQAIGAILVLLMNLAGKNPLAIDAYKVFYDMSNDFLPSDQARANQYMTWQELFSHNSVFGNNDLLKRIAIKLIDSKRIGHTSALDEVIEQLNVDSSQYEYDSKLHELSKIFIDDLKQLVNFPNKSIHELLERYTRLHSRALVLFFAQEDCSALLSFNDPLWGDSEAVAAAILFAIRDGWLKLPNSLKEQLGLRGTTPFIMAKISHQISNSQFDLGDAPARPKSLLELLLRDPWTNSQKQAALHLSRVRKWQCIQTKISLGKGGYQLNIDGSGAHFYVDGDVNVEPKIDREAFFKYFKSDTAMTPKLELILRKTMASSP